MGQLKEIIRGMGATKVFRLIYNGEVRGYRVGYFDPERMGYTYFDFDTEVASKNSNVSWFLLKTRDITSDLNLVAYQDLLATEDEIKSGVAVQSFDDAALLELSLKKVLHLVTVFKENVNV